jgi:hypothetical protein
VVLVGFRLAKWNAGEIGMTLDVLAAGAADLSREGAVTGPCEVDKPLTDRALEVEADLLCVLVSHKQILSDLIGRISVLTAG